MRLNTRTIFLLPLLLIFTATVSLYSQEVPETDLNPETGFPVIKEKPFVMFDEGLSFALLTRLELNDDRSNFVHQNYLAGAYLQMQTMNMQPVNSIIRVSAYYPFYNTFNGMQQTPKQVILYAFDLYAGPKLEADMWKYVKLNFSAGLHYMYQLTDEYHMHYLGAGLLTSVELPVTKRWTVLANGTATLDYPNLGTNKNIQPYKMEWQTHLDVGVRYSKRGENKYSYIFK